MKLKLSEFNANDDMELHFKDNSPCSNIKDAETYFLKKGEAIPEIFVLLYLKNNPKFIQNLEIKNGIPILSEEQEKKYGISFKPPVPTTFQENMEKEMKKYTLEGLTVKSNKLGKANFKEWAEKKFGEDKIDKRKSTSNIIVDILELQEAE